MARGTPDYGIYQYQQAQSQGDLSQIPLMLWGFAPLDYRGRVLFFDTFNNGLGAWTTSKGMGGDGTVELVSEHAAGVGVAFVPPKACKLYPVNIIGRTASILRSYMLPGGTRIGVELGLRYVPQSGDIYLLNYYTPNATDTYRYQVYWSSQNKKWYVSHADGTDYAIYDADYSALHFAGGSTLFFQVKLTVDLVQNRYIKFQTGDVVVDLSTYQPKLFPVQAQYLLYTSVYTQVKVLGANSPWYVGYVLQTTDEP